MLFHWETDAQAHGLTNPGSKYDDRSSIQHATTAVGTQNLI